MLTSYGFTPQEKDDLLEALHLAIQMTDQVLRATFSQDALLDQGKMLEPDGRKVYHKLAGQIQRFRNLIHQLKGEQP